jgi:prepilin-type N-terminal cleavage/methylation domain-containing protein
MRTSNRKVNKGFTLIELVLVIAILGVLAVAALPSLFNVSLTNARTNAMNGTVGAIQSGISLYAASAVAAGSSMAHPSNLDTVSSVGTATGTNGLFGGVLAHPITSGSWYRSGTLAAGTECFIYDLSGDGNFNDAADGGWKYTVGAAGTGMSFSQLSNGTAACP